MDNFYDKVFGCWLGKCIGGNVGAPFEGMKQRMSLEFSSEYVHRVIPNDDLDLQILWLDLLEEKGADITVEDMAKAFYDNCPYAPGEYAYFKKNYEKGIMPPLSGTFNNEFFGSGMGSPIRSEIWACLFPDDPDRALDYAKMDSRIDHKTGGESENGEVFLTVLECYAFQGGEPFALVEKALEYLSDQCKLKAALKDMLIWCKETADMAEIQRRILRKYGHSESCMAVENICILVGAFLLHGTDFKGAIMEAVNCGFDADCTGASLGSVLGILLGGEKIKEIFGVEDMLFKLGVKSPRQELTASALARDTVALARKFKEEKEESKRFYVEQIGNPCISFGEIKKIVLLIRAPKGAETKKAVLTVAAPATLKQSEYTIFGKENYLEVEISVPDTETLPEGLRGEVFVEGEKIGTFGISVRRRWQVFGPYWKNEVVIPPLTNGLTYGKFVPGDRGNRDEVMDHMRLFHLSCLPADGPESIEELLKEPFAVEDTDEDIIKLETCTYFHGNATYYFRTYFYSDEEMTTGIQIGRNTPIKVWLNDEFLAEKDGNETFYHEVIHKLSVKVKKGINTLTFKVVKNTEAPRFSYNFLKNGVCNDHRTFGIVNITSEKGGEDK